MPNRLTVRVTALTIGHAFLRRPGRVDRPAHIDRPGLRDSARYPGRRGPPEEPRSGSWVVDRADRVPRGRGRRADGGDGRQHPAGARPGLRPRAAGRLPAGRGHPAVLRRRLRRDGAARGQHRRLLHLRRLRAGQAARGRGRLPGRHVVLGADDRAGRRLRLLRHPDRRLDGRRHPVAAVERPRRRDRGRPRLPLDRPVRDGAGHPDGRRDRRAAGAGRRDPAAGRRPRTAAVGVHPGRPDHGRGRRPRRRPDVRLHQLRRLRVRGPVRRGGPGAAPHHPPRHLPVGGADRGVLPALQLAGGGRPRGRRHPLRGGEGAGQPAVPALGPLRRRPSHGGDGTAAQHLGAGLDAGGAQRGVPLPVRARPGAAAAGGPGHPAPASLRPRPGQPGADGGHRGRRGRVRRRRLGPLPGAGGRVRRAVDGRGRVAAADGLRSRWSATSAG